MKDNEILIEIRSGNLNPALKFLLKEFPKIRTMMLAAGGNAQDAQEVFNDSLILLVEKVQQPDFSLTSKMTTYLYGINRFLWMNHLRKNQKNVELEWKDTLILTAEDLEYQEEKESRLKQLEHILKSISKKCQELLRRFYFESESMKIIANAMNFSSINSAKTQKYKCMERAIQVAKSNPLISKS